MKKIYGIIILCFCVILAVIFWRMFINDVGEKNLFSLEKTIKRQEQTSHSNVTMTEQNKEGLGKENEGNDYDGGDIGDDNEERIIAPYQYTAFDFLPARIALRDGAEAMVTRWGRGHGYISCH